MRFEEQQRLLQLHNMDDDRNREKGYKPRLRWSCELQNKFIDAVNQLGGPDKATPMGLMRIMEIPELTLYHLKSHLQKYRHIKCQRFVGYKHHVSAEAQNPRDQLDIIVTEKDDHQKKLYEQNEVQRLLQVRIETQGKYLQSVLMKAQETLFGHTSSNLGTNFARSETYGVESIGSCVSSNISELTQADEEEEEVEEAEGYLGTKKPENRGTRQTRSSVDSSVTSSENLDSETVNESQSVMRR